jgi:arylsulfatase A-like enzyme
MRSTSAWFLCVLFAWSLGHAGAADGDVGERYNIISIVTDDQARWAVGNYGNREVQTPNMDRLGAGGAKFLNAFVPTPVCSPSRVSFLTGLYDLRNDPGELKNRFDDASLSNVRDQLEKRLEAWMRSIDAPLLRE